MPTLIRRRPSSRDDADTTGAKSARHVVTRIIEVSHYHARGPQDNSAGLVRPDFA
jgi:hypothetical protein